MNISNSPKDKSIRDLINIFIYHSMVRGSKINREIDAIREDHVNKEEEYRKICEVILFHVNDIRMVILKIEAMDINENEKKELLAAISILSIEKIIYNMGHALIEMRKVSLGSNINTCFVRKTRKFWIYPENVDTIMALILEHLPVYIFGDDGSGKISSSINSVYLDSKNFDLYQQRIRRLQGSKALRIRRYGESAIIAYVEQKTHEHGWTGEKSTKKRFLIHTKCIDELLRGEDIWEDIKSINTPESYELYKEVHNMITSLSLVPIIKTAYTRTAFQIPNDSSIRISIDTNLTMWNEVEGKRFPYIVLEVKLEEDVEYPWINQLINSPLVIPVDKFSKYLHGCAIHYPHVPSIPYWYNQMESIVRDPVHLEYTSPAHEDFQNLNSTIKNILKNIPHKTIPTQHLQNQEAPQERSSSSSTDSENRSCIEDQVLEDSVSYVNRPATMNEQERDRTTKLFERIPIKQPENTAAPLQNSEKPIVVPVRIEPKVFFANERTFLSWLHFAIFIGGIGAALMGLGDRNAALSGICFIVVSLIFSIYALYLYIWRAKKIRDKNPGPYDDHSGPVILVAVFVAAMITSVFFKFPVK
ncbi:hypothetical protein NEFER03_2150 [Nematocida sp. LUAm3]|nr:hypothetical protein NEFER03_2150 [Nematocida sp. LUAm3]KAI5174621.1 hypothetical protein NEFER02_0742 [Nematocida sp. LUAm2]KAI5177973.1 hypothetical protein NEFER01_1155 [Nematocida sp. LUAm1]